MNRDVNFLAPLEPKILLVEIETSAHKVICFYIGFINARRTKLLDINILACSKAETLSLF